MNSNSFLILSPRSSYRFFKSLSAWSAFAFTCLETRASTFVPGCATGNYLLSSCDDSIVNDSIPLRSSSLSFSATGSGTTVFFIIYNYYGWLATTGVLSLYLFYSSRRFITQATLVVISVTAGASTDFYCSSTLRVVKSIPLTSFLTSSKHYSYFLMSSISFMSFSMLLMMLRSMVFVYWLLSRSSG